MARPALELTVRPSSLFFTLVAMTVLRPEHALHASFHNVDRPKSARPVVPQNIPLDVVYEDADMLVINKPSGMTVQLAQGAAENAVAFHLNATTRWGTPEWPWNSDSSFEGIVHRLDKGTSGLLAVGKHPAAARALSAAFRERRVDKTYLAIGVGLPARRSLLSLEAVAAANSQKSRSKAMTPASSEEQKVLANKIKACGRDGERAVGLLEDAFASGELPGAPCYAAALTVCTRGAGPTSVASSRAAGPRRERVTSRRASIDDAEAKGERERALSLLDLMHDRDVTPNLACFRTALGLCAREPPLWEKAVELVDRMVVCGVGPTASCASAAISACGRAGQLAAALRLLDTHTTVLLDDDDDKEDGNSCLLRAAIRAAERCQDADTARLLAGRLDLKQQSGGVASTTQQQSPASSPMLVDYPIGKVCKYTMGIIPIASGGREARSVVTPLAFDGVCSLNRVAIETGRTHQIRVHMASCLGCPIAGDRDYGSRRHRGATSLGTPLGASIPRAPRVMLHAAELVLPHPTTGQTLRLACPPPQDFLDLAGAIIRGSSEEHGPGSTDDADAAAAIDVLLTRYSR